MRETRSPHWAMVWLRMWRRVSSSAVARQPASSSTKINPVPRPVIAHQGYPTPTKHYDLVLITTLEFATPKPPRRCVILPSSESRNSSYHLRPTHAWQRRCPHSSHPRSIPPHHRQTAPNMPHPERDSSREEESRHLRHQHSASSDQGIRALVPMCVFPSAAYTSSCRFGAG